MRTMDRGRQDGAPGDLEENRMPTAYEEDKKDAGENCEEPEKQEVEGNAYDTKRDADQAYEGDTQREHETYCKQDKEADTFENIGDMDQRCEEDSERARLAEKLRNSQFQDSEVCHVPDTAWLAQAHARIQGSTSTLLKRWKRKWGMTVQEKGVLHNENKQGS
ncbi:hypothetical protein NDU88_000703 [Pleurodeles waltl]|uniref:Uncharacterized protein n=1 Tax=Pleurodeles waltl TaxID=8319 RepID=A0AAV7KQN2_PLEWA|nr:hypothetical protein NDU88_000703 [Pleurodeles waltl]